MSFSFPPSPTPGQIYTFGSRSWQWDATNGVWVLVSGAPISTGPTGPAGLTGPAGPTGSSGASGASGVSGVSGSSGVSGASGVSGVSGSSGFSGVSGSSGVSGFSGVAGPGTAINATDDTATNSTFYPVFVSTAGSNQTPKVSTTKLYFNPSTGRISAVDFNNLSDAQYKTEIEPIQNGLAIVHSLKPVNFKWKDTGNRSYGLVAQDVQQIVPEAVSESNGNLHVNYIQLISILIDAVQTQSQEIAFLKKQFGHLTS